MCIIMIYLFCIFNEEDCLVIVSYSDRPTKKTTKLPSSDGNSFGAKAG